MSLSLPRPAWRAPQPALLLALATFGACLYLAMRNSGLAPFVFGDELTYSTMARLNRLQDASLPSYLYLWLARGSNACGSGFLDCIRVANVLLFGAATPFLYLLARRVCSRPRAAAVALAALLAPANSFTAYFMPEAPYYFGFAVLAWSSLALRDRGWQRHAIASGAVLGLMLLVKVHALFLLPAQVLFMLACRRANWRQALYSAALMLLVALGLRIGIGYALAGPAGLHPLGAMYAAHADSRAAGLATLLPAALANLRGHLMGLALLFSLPLCVLTYALLRRRAEPIDVALAELRLYAALMLLAPLAMAVAYTASIYAIEGTRVHMRYYDFAFPLLLIVGASAGQTAPRARALAPALAAGAALCMVYASVALAPAFRLVFVDCPELAGLLQSRPWLFTLLALQLLILLAWVLSARLAGKLFVFVLLPLGVLQGELATRAEPAKGARPSLYDQAGRFVRGYLDPAQRGQLSIAGDGASNLMRAKFHADDATIRLIDLPANAALAPQAQQPPGQWLLVVGPHPLAPGMQPVAQGAGFALVRLRGQARRLWQLDFTSAEPQLAMAERMDGLSNAEQWGRWSTGKQVTLQFRRPLPRELVLTISARAFGPNAGQPFVLRIGQIDTPFVLGPDTGDVTLHLATDGAQRSMTIVVPQPISPTALGRHPDPRTLGIGLHSILVATPDSGT